MKPLDLTGKTAFVSGSAHGLGAVIAKALAQHGAIVVVHYRNSTKDAHKTLQEIQKISPQSFAVSADLTQEKEVHELFQKIGPVDILINTIGNFLLEPIDKTSFATFRDVIESNLYATFLCSHEVLGGMKKRKNGAIINFGSVGCERVLLRPKTTPYYIAKTGVYMLTKIMAEKYAKDGIRINMISPGILPTSIVMPTINPAQRISFDDIIHAILFLLNPQSHHIIGANIEVSAGWSPELATSD